MVATPFLSATFPTLKSLYGARHKIIHLVSQASSQSSLAEVGGNR
jgi:hypothetical protein